MIITVFPLEEHGRAVAAQSAVGENGDAVAEQVCLVHEVSGQNHRPAAPLLLQDVPRLTAGLRVHAGRRLVQYHKLHAHQTGAPLLGPYL